jgi:hypothetical protein
MSINAMYAVVSEKGKDFTLFMGNGTKLQAKGITFEAQEKTSAVLEYKDGEYYFTCEAPVIITTAKNKKTAMLKTSYRKIKL